jgi:hypothetical protein
MATVLHACPPKVGPKGELGVLAGCFERHGVVNSFVYQPPSRFWALQAIEFGLYVGASAALLGLAVWSIRRRLA